MHSAPPIVFLILGVVLIAFGAIGALHAQRVWRTAQTGMARLLEKTTEAEAQHVLWVDWQGGRTRLLAAKRDWESRLPGDMIPVYCDPRKPGILRQGTRMSIALAVWFFRVCLAVGLVVAFLAGRALR